jgi:hypothetical protein
MGRITLFAALFIVVQPRAPAQLVSVGVTGGVPISDHSQDYGTGCMVTHDPVLANTCGPNRFFMKPYAVGPTIAIHLPWRISVEAGMLYERFHQDVAHGIEVSHSNPVDFGQYFGVSANGWLFPLQLKYTFAKRTLSPFVNAGATLRHLGSFDGTGTQADYYLNPQPASFHIESGRNLDVAVTVGAGVRWRVGVFDISPEVRFLRWTSAYYQPAQNQAMLMLGIAFLARR